MFFTPLLSVHEREEAAAPPYKGSGTAAAVRYSVRPVTVKVMVIVALAPGTV